MGFDANNPEKPLVNVHKKTTQVNLWMVVGVLIFFVVCAVAIVKMRQHHGPDQPQPPEERMRP